MPSIAAAPPGERSAGRILPLLTVGLLLAVAAILWYRAGSARRPAAAAGPRAGLADASSPANASSPADAAEELPPPVAPVTALPSLDPARLGAIGEGEDARTARELVEKLRGGVPVGLEDVRLAESLIERHGEPARELFASVAMSAAARHRSARQYEDAVRLLERAVQQAGNPDVPRHALLAVLAEQSSWPAAEQVAREILVRSPDDRDAVRVLSYALVRQDRGREAEDVLRAYLAGHKDDVAQALLARVGHDSRFEGTLRQQAISHFHVRYDGQAHEDVGREVLSVLERHYAVLATTFDYEPGEPIPVVLLATPVYRESSGAPAWAGGHYDSFDGRVRIPIGGLTSSPGSQLEATIVHELTHAFVAGRSGGVAPRELHEGLAQVMAGGRSSDAAVQALVDGRIQGVSAFYLAALVFVEELLRERGQGGINDVLAQMARTRDPGQAFREVYGRDYGESLQTALARWRQQHGG